MTPRLYVEALGAAAGLVLDGACALGLLPDFFSDFDALARRSLLSIELVTVAAPNHPLALIDGPVPPEMLRAHVQLVLTDRSGLTGSRDYGVVASWGIAKLTDHSPRWAEQPSVPEITAPSGRTLLPPDFKDLREGAPIVRGFHQMPTRTEMAIIMLCAKRNRRAWEGDLNRCICRSRRRVGRCEFSARLFSNRLFRCRTSGSISRCATL